MIRNAPRSAPALPSSALERGAFQIDGTPRLLRGGTVQWYRMPEAMEARHLDLFAASGMNTVDIYVPWNDVEPLRGQFDTALLDRLERFLGRIQERGLFAYFRPGPYICNEWDGGGVPSWLRPLADPRSTTQEGRLNFRSGDPDWLRATEGYLRKIFERVRPHLRSNGGPVVLVALENEFDYQELFFQLEKVFCLGGRPERGPRQSLDGARYMRFLRDLAKDSAIDVPLTTCPGQPGLKGTGGVLDLTPLPNNYSFDGIERRNLKFLKALRGRNAALGGPSEVPSGTTEGPRTATAMKRALFGGMKAYFAFNAHGFAQEGYANTVILDPSMTSAPLSLISPRFGYLQGALDFYGSVSPNGTPREVFYNFRRANLFLETFESQLASADLPRLTKQGGRPRLRARREVSVRARGIGARDGWFGRRTHALIEAQDGTTFVSLLNDSPRAVTIPIGGIQVRGRRLPEYAELVVPPEVMPPRAGPDREEASNAQILVVDHPITPNLRLAWCTAEITTLRPFGAERLLALSGEPGTTTELAFDQLAGPARVLHADPEFTVRDATGERFVATIDPARSAFMVLESAEGERLVVWSMPRREAGRVWFFDGQDGPFAVAPLDRATFDAARGELELEHAVDPERREATSHTITVFGPGAPHFPELSEASPALGPVRATRYALELPPVDVDLAPDLLTRGRLVTDLREVAPDFDDSAWTSWEGPARGMDSLGVHRGHGWYRARVDLGPEDDPRRFGALRVEGASDFVGLYVNGQYITTVAPVGTRIDNASKKPRYGFESLAPHLVSGTNVLAFRVESWGHSAFESPTGTLLGIPRVRLPAVSIRSERGLLGHATLGGRPIERWTFRGGLGGERADPFATGAPREATIPLELEPGAVVWYETEIRPSDLPKREGQRVPLALGLSGQNAKATLWFDDALIGRWLSDTGWLRRSNWANPSLTQFSSHDPNQIPLPESRWTGDTHRLRIAFEDTSKRTGPRGRIDTLALQLAREERGVEHARKLEVPIVRVTRKLVARPEVQGD